jgi:hypothetical protein
MEEEDSRGRMILVIISQAGDDAAHAGAVRLAVANLSIDSAPRDP